MLQIEKPSDYVISTGRTESIKNFVDLSCKKLGFQINWIGEGLNTKCVNSENGEPIVEIKEEFFRPSEVDLLIGDSTKAKVDLKWTPKISLEELCGEMVDYDSKNF